MKPFPRLLDLRTCLAQKSHFLFGPRQTGKTWLIRQQLSEYKNFDLLESDTLLSLGRNPSLLREQCDERDRIVVIDEIQKLPSLLDEVQLLIERHNLHFLLTGSSARKLRRGGTNLLGGRARSLHLHPLTYPELEDRFDLLKALNHGLLPSIYESDDPVADLRAYSGDYLREEIAAEGLTRNVPAFSRFLQVAALCNGQIINYTKISNDAQVPRSTVQEYFAILRDTLIGHELTPWQKTIKRKPLATSKFYFFDVGVVRCLQQRGEVNRTSADFGEALETYVFHELKSYSDLHGSLPLSYWRSRTGFEVDFVLANQTAIEVKGTANVRKREIKGLDALREEGLLKQYVVVSLERRSRQTDGIEFLPVEEFLDRLWGGEFTR